MSTRSRQVCEEGQILVMAGHPAKILIDLRHSTGHLDGVYSIAVSEMH